MSDPVRYRGKLPARPTDMNPDELDEECRQLIDLISAEFESDPLSTQCFDSRIVSRVKLAAQMHRWYRDDIF